VNSKGKHQERLFKLTIDSLLNLDDSKIKTEISFSGIEEVTPDREYPEVIWLKFKAETVPRKIICNTFSKLLWETLQECVFRNKRDNLHEEDGELRNAEGIESITADKIVLEILSHHCCSRSQIGCYSGVTESPIQSQSPRDHR
jgi:hypothetical protein